MSNSKNNITAKDIMDDDANSIVLGNFYRDMLKGCGGRCYSRIYLDLDENRLFENVEASCNSWLHRDDGSLVEIVADSGWGADLTDEELEWLDFDGPSEFGYSDWLDYTVEPAIQNALDHWQSRNEGEHED